MILKKTETHIIEMHEFETKESAKRMSNYWGVSSYHYSRNGEILFQGKPSEVTEKMANEWVQLNQMKFTYNYKDYSLNNFHNWICTNALDSFKSAVTKSWIIITKRQWTN